MATDHARLQAKVKQVEDLLEDIKLNLHRPGLALGDRASAALEVMEEANDLLNELLVEDD